MTKTKTLAARRFELMAAEYLERMGARIKARREELGLTQDEVAGKMPGKVNGQRISLWERGKNRPRDDALEALAGVLDVDVSYFMASEPTNGDTPDLMEIARPFGLEGSTNRLEAKLDWLIDYLVKDEQARDEFRQAFPDGEPPRS